MSFSCIEYNIINTILKKRVRLTVIIINFLKLFSHKIVVNTF